MESEKRREYKRQWYINKKSKELGIDYSDVYRSIKSKTDLDIKEGETYSKAYYKAHSEKWKEYADSKKGLFIYYIRDLSLEEMESMYYIGSTTNLANRLSWHKTNSKGARIYPIIKKEHSYEVRYLDLLGIDMTAEDITVIEEYYIRLYQSLNKNLDNGESAVREYNEVYAKELIQRAIDKNIKWKLLDYKVFDNKISINTEDKSINSLECDLRILKFKEKIDQAGFIKDYCLIFN